MDIDNRRQANRKIDGASDGFDRDGFHPRDQLELYRSKSRTAQQSASRSNGPYVETAIVGNVRVTNQGRFFPVAALIGPELMRYGIQRITEADMPQTKRADLAFSIGTMQLPMEVKGQWHDDVWSAATDQLDARYLIDWRSEQRGVYCVLWSGNLPASSGRRLKPPPNGLTSPTTAEEMRRTLILTIPLARRHLIDVVVLDFTAGSAA